MTLAKSFEVEDFDNRKSNRITVILKKKDIDHLKYHLEVLRRTLKHKNYEILVIDPSEISEIDSKNQIESPVLDALSSKSGSILIRNPSGKFYRVDKSVKLATFAKKLVRHVSKIGTFEELKQDIANGVTGK